MIVAGALAGEGRLSLPVVIGVAAGAAIVGDNVGYLLGRRGLRRLIDRAGRGAERQKAADRERGGFFVRHGAAAVFFGRWLPGLRVAAAWLAGESRMPWRRFLLWNALGGLTWAATIGSLAYVLGRSASGSLAAVGFIGVADRRARLSDCPISPTPSARLRERGCRRTRFRSAEQEGARSHGGEGQDSRDAERA